MRTQILHEDADIIVVYKPAGLATQAAGSFQVDVMSELNNYLVLQERRKQLANQKKKPDGNVKGKRMQLPTVFLIHRLDQPVEGILVFAKNKESAANLSKQVQAHTMTKEYVAMVYDGDQKLAKDQKQLLTDYLKKDAGGNTSRVVSSSDKEAKKATLTYEVVEKEQQIAFVKILLQTGRHHQIRVQMSNAGLPLLGDQKYGTEESIKESISLGIKDVWLCAHRLVFEHPKTKEKMEFSVTPKNVKLLKNS